MEEFEKFLKQIASKPSCGVGFVIVPPDVTRQEYIDRCYSTETISMMSQSGGMSFNNVPVSQDALGYIEFPEKGKFGSMVVFVFHPKLSKPIVIAALSKGNEMYGLNWKQFKHFKSEGNNYISVIGDGKRGTLCVTLRGEENNGGGKVYISLAEPSKKGQFTLSVQGDVSIIGNNISLSAEGIKIDCKEDFEVSSNKAIVSAEEKVSLGKENYEPIVLGNKLKDDILQPLMDALQNLQVDPITYKPLPTFIASIVQITAKLNTILSQKVESE